MQAELIHGKGLQQFVFTIKYVRETPQESLVITVYHAWKFVCSRHQIWLII